MKNILSLLPLTLLIGCSSTRTSLNCEKLHTDSETRLAELKQILISYQDVNYDLAVKLSPPLKEEVRELDSRVRKQKMRCWASEKRPIDADMALLKEELFKVYGESEELKAPRTIASKPRKPAAETVTPEQAEIINSVELDPVE